MLSRIFPFQPMAISEVFGSLAPWLLCGPFPGAHILSSPLRIMGLEGNFRRSICSTLVVWYPTQPGPGLCGPPHLPITPGAVPLHLAPGVPQPHQLHFLTLEQSLGQREKALLLWAFLERGFSVLP